MNVVKECAHCGEPVTSLNLRALYCGKRCKDRARRARDRAAGRITHVRKGPSTRPRPVKHKPGDRHGSLVIVARLGTVNGSARVLCRCDCGIDKELSLQNVLSGKTLDCASREHHPDPRFKGDRITYDGAHNRVKAIKGSASRHPCARCGNPAEQWAYSHADVAQQQMNDGREKGRPYSANTDHYMPLCRSCHIGFNNSRRQWATREALSLEYFAAWVFRNPEAFARQFSVKVD